MRSFGMMMAAGALMIAGAMTTAGEVAAQEANRQITVVGHGQVFAVPDMVEITVGVQTRAKTAAAAMAETNEKLARLIAIVKEEGVEDRDVQTAQINLYAEYDRSSTGGTNKIIGYNASNTLSVRLRDVEAGSVILDKLVTAGANQVHGMRLSVQNPKPHQNEARKKAVADALAKAKLFAEAAGVELGSVLWMNETAGVSVPVAAYARGADFESAVPISAGEQGINAEVKITLELKGG